MPAPGRAAGQVLKTLQWSVFRAPILLGTLKALGLFLALGCGRAVAERPLLPELPQGPGSASFAGGGTGHSSGVNSVFDNPAALSVRDVLQTEAGFMGLAAGVS